MFQCNICNNNNKKLIMQKNGFDIVRCNDCGLIYVDGDITKEMLEISYNREYYEDYYHYMERSKERERGFKERFLEIKRIIPKPKKLLEIGCAFGLFLNVAKEGGWDVYGVELSEYSSSFAREKYGLNVKTGDLCELTLESGYDVVVMWDTIEHLIDPRKYLNEIYRILNKDGILIFHTTDLGSLGAKILGKRWSIWVPPLHLYYFTRSSIKKLLKKTGFEIVKIESRGNFFSVLFENKKIPYSVKRLFLNKYVNKTFKKLNIGHSFTVYAKKSQLF